MPGICGIIGKSDHVLNKSHLATMMDCMSHNPSFSHGYYINEDLDIYLGWVAHPGSFSDCLPIFNETKDVVLVFTGEEFTEKETISRIRSNGHTFDHSNASYLVHLYEENGIGFLRALNGLFSGVLIDCRRKESCLFVDRYGMKRIYFHEKEGIFYFSSEAKSILRVLPELRRLDPISLGHFIKCGSVMDNRTLFSGVSLLPGGSSWKFEKGICTGKERYFQPEEWENLESIDQTRFHDLIEEAIQKVIPRYFESVSRVGMSLTGGLDTRIIMSHLGSDIKELPCYTFGGMYRDCYDVKIARNIAKSCGQSFRVLPIGESFLKNFGDFAEKTVYLTDGVSDVCGSHEIFLNRLAKKVAPIRMTGLFGSEIIRSVAYIKADFPTENIFNKEFDQSISNALETFNKAKQGHPHSYVVFKLIPWHLQGNYLAAQTELIVRTPFLDNRIVGLMYHGRKDENLSLRIVRGGNPKLSKISTDRGIKDSGFYLFKLLPIVYYNFLFKAEYGFDRGMPHWLSFMENYFDPFKLERYFIGRHKIEHYRLWFKNDLSEYIKMILLDNRSNNRNYIGKKVIERIVFGHISGKKNYTNEINKLLTMELIQKFFINNN
jgi:asparagine synthase (glutamine-hydrolysing)